MDERDRWARALRIGQSNIHDKYLPCGTTSMGTGRRRHKELGGTQRMSRAVLGLIP